MFTTPSWFMSQSQVVALILPVTPVAAMFLPWASTNFTFVQATAVVPFTGKDGLRPKVTTAAWPSPINDWLKPAPIPSSFPADGDTVRLFPAETNWVPARADEYVSKVGSQSSSNCIAATEAPAETKLIGTSTVPPGRPEASDT